MSAFDKVIGYEKEKEELYQLCDMAKNSAKYAALGVKLPRGILLYGVPGVGKTLMATALLDEMDNGRKRYILRKDKAIEEFVESISKTFQEAKENAPSVIFLDDLDKFASDSNSRNPEELIAVQSGIDEVKGADVFVVATANDVRVLPNSLRRPGRFDRILEICTPNRREAVEIVRHYLKGKKVADDVTAEGVARLMDGNSCAALESVLNEAGIYAGYENKTEIKREHIVRAVLRDIFEADESVNEISVAAKEEVAFHEAGHAVAALAFDPEGVGLISIRPSKSDARGVVQILRAKITSVLTIKCMSASFLCLRAVPPWNSNSVIRMSGLPPTLTELPPFCSVSSSTTRRAGLRCSIIIITTVSVRVIRKTVSRRNVAPCLPVAMKRRKTFFARIGRLSKNSRRRSSNGIRLYSKRSPNSAKKWRHKERRHMVYVPPFADFGKMLFF